jgi:MFS family permease
VEDAEAHQHRAPPLGVRQADRRTRYLLDSVGSAEREVPRQIFLGTLAQSGVLIVASVVCGRLSDRIGLRKACWARPRCTDRICAVRHHHRHRHRFNGFLVGTAIGGLGFGANLTVDLALVVDVLPDGDNTARALGVFNYAGALPFSIAPAMAPVVLAVGSGSYGVLYAVAGVCALLGAASVLLIKGVR